VVEALVEHGANPDALNLEHETPLHIAVRHTSLRTITFLCDRSANLDAMSVHGNTAFRNLLETFRPRGDTQLNSATKLDMLACLITAGCDVNKSFFQTDDLMGVSYYNGSPLGYLFEFFPVPIRASDTNSKIAARLVGLVLMIIEAGYRPSYLDLCQYRQSWLHFILGSSYLEEKISQRIHRPNRLVDVCRVRLRGLLAKPIGRSLRDLELPEGLKEFLLLK